MTRAIAIAPGGVFTSECIDSPERQTPAAAAWLDAVPHTEGFKQTIKKVEAQILKAALAEAGGNKMRAAAILGIQRRLLYEKMREHGLAM